MVISEFCGTCIYDRQKCKLSPLTQTSKQGRLYCSGKRSKYESGFKQTDICDICGEKFTDIDYISFENIVWEIRYPVVFERIEYLRVFSFDIHKRCLTRENQEMLSRKVKDILEESKTI